MRGRLSVEELWRRHSLVNVMAVGLDADYAARLRSGLYPWEGPETRPLGCTLQSCPVCIDEDARRYGFAYWRLSHQWSGFSTCIHHGVELQDRLDCLCDNQRYYWKLRPDSACITCGCSVRRGVRVCSEPGPIDQEYRAAFLDARRGSPGYSFWDLDLLRRWTNAANFFLRKQARRQIRERLEPAFRGLGCVVHGDDQDWQLARRSAEHRLSAFAFHRLWHKLIFDRQVVDEVGCSRFARLALAFHAGESVPPYERRSIEV
ncbi:TniQ family protein [Roseateles chitinivorans]|uniref:TniQ family protein n=1 Tax=Roseateles chitinivorans TaxID=2917965 RepID=UPI003D66BD13